MEQTRICTEILELIKEGKEKVLASQRTSGDIYAYSSVDIAIYAGWYAKTMTLLKSVCPEDNDFISQFEKYGKKNSIEYVKAAIGILENALEYFQKGLLIANNQKEMNAETSLNLVFSQFHRVARQIRCRYESRPTIDINDEYDVQDLLHALLLLFFDDVRTEEWTPSYAGKSARMDFLLKKERIVIEVKKTRKGLADKDLGDQLIIDVDRYKVHPDCGKLVCFIYDPEGRIGNPAGLKSDLNRQHQGFAEIIIEPG